MNTGMRAVPRRAIWLGVFVVAFSMLVVACSQDTKDTTTTTTTEAAAVETTAAGAGPPAPFDAGPVKVALVQNSGAGDYFQQ